MIFLIDYNLNGQALILYGSLGNQGWLDSVESYQAKGHGDNRLFV